MKAAFLAGIAALFLATGTAHAREVHDKGIKRECQIKLNDEQTKIANFDEIKTCIKGFWPTIPDPKKGEWVINYLPPQEYDHPFTGILMIQRLSLDEISKICLAKHRTGCSLVLNTDNGVYLNNRTGNRTACIAIVANDAGLQAEHMQFSGVLRHEIAHCNGWPGDHPGMESKYKWVEK
jgi:hypothetical protein